MIKTSIENLTTLLREAKEKGCSQVKLQLYDNWQDVAKEQQKPTQKLEEYQIDTRFYNTVEFDAEIKDMQSTDKILTKMEGDTFIIRVALSDRDSLMKNLGIEE